MVFQALYKLDGRWCKYTICVSFYILLNMNSINKVITIVSTQLQVYILNKMKRLSLSSRIFPPVPPQPPCFRPPHITMRNTHAGVRGGLFSTRHPQAWHSGGLGRYPRLTGNWKKVTRHLRCRYVIASCRSCHAMQRAQTNAPPVSV